ncbi:unnamed protein product [Tuber melanosporum]|uniref:(Perigord truffle) hypothetical protein n=1 Tax=Tuber melanosporum (strain Mel28) TaxID=656061 RepID=D5GG60_TUBMM|nr:uncharacterized protein GSTUM_00007209001 [Tuber melanosporum]CAZ83503.1 unnamed protein product [Tuber melanosporum]
MTIKNLLIIIHLDLLLPLAVFLNLYLYFYPVFHFCAFTPQPDGGAAPFRLLALADPQLEGDSTLLKYRAGQPTEATAPTTGTSSLWDYVHPTDIGLTIRGLGKVLDLWGNDLYLRHIFRSTRQMLAPTHTIVLGDLLGSQWISDEEFKIRGERFWRIFGGEEGKVTSEDVQRYAGDIAADEEARAVWRKKVIIVPGNHDIGYAGDMDWNRITRFEEMFGVANYIVKFMPNTSSSVSASNIAGEAAQGEESQKIPPTLRLVILNSLPLDSPIFDPTIQDASYALIDQSLESKSPSLRQSSLLLTHLPLHKPAGLCADAPLITHYPAHHGGGIKEQNHLSEAVSELLLDQIFGVPAGDDEDDNDKAKKEPGMILTGHDHVGCDVRHTWVGGETGWNRSSWEEWQHGETARAEATETAKSGTREDGLQGVREVTVRSMMGEFGGNAGLVSAWFDHESDSWKFEYQTCKLGIQHVWWTVHIIDVIVAITGAILFMAYKRDEFRNAEAAARVQEVIDSCKKDE